MKSRVTFVVSLLIALIKISSACNGFDVILRSVTNCGDDKQVVKISKNSTTTINNMCEVHSFTCADVKTYNQATAVVTIKRNNMVIFNGTENLCQKKKKQNELALVMMSVCGLRCSMKESSFCDGGLKIVTFSTTKKLFSIVGGDSLKTRVVVKHDTGSSCFESDLSIHRH